ncbi:MAG: Glu-tRNA(Gln) amidotransferase subunit GatD [Nitrososphaeria archaeon]|nr:Glu-tRNA(Gln) amidotransferase subunit GatD [Nitrososphaeria archaeon]MDW8043318.1 Glu-tRNA(Gln) amidotransferase subunit GatD [Nitrososphaerota archaeon]
MGASGYRGRLGELLESLGAEVGDELEVVTADGTRYVGYLISRPEYAEDGVITLKLRNGYNVGIVVDDRTTVRRLSRGRAPAFVRGELPPSNPDLPRVALIGTGGTIASRVDYRTGAVRPAMTTEDLVSTVREVAEVANVESEVVLSIYSENMTQREWDLIARAVHERIEGGYDGVVVAHGTDTMAYTAAALSFALQRPPVPVVLVGAQRSSDRPSSDAATNLLAALLVAGKAPFAEVVVAMHAWHSDDVIAVHRGTRVVKLHTSSRDAFRSVNSRPVAYVRDGKLVVKAEGLHPRSADDYSFEPGFDERAVLLKFFPGMRAEVLEALWEMGYRGFVLEGTGLGHVTSSWIPAIRRLVGEGAFVGMGSQCRFGRVNMNVYDNGRDLLAAGVTPLSDMLPEVAYVKLCWALHRFNDPSEVRRAMLTPVAGEIGERSLPVWTERGDLA